MRASHPPSLPLFIVSSCFISVFLSLLSLILQKADVLVEKSSPPSERKKFSGGSVFFGYVYKFFFPLHRSMVFGKGGFVRSDRILLFSVLLLIVALLFYFLHDEILQAGYAVADCVDTDGDGYYAQGCSLEDLGCAGETAFVTEGSTQESLSTDGEYLVYKDDRTGDWDIYLYDPSSASSLLLSSPGTIDTGPQVSSSSVVWQSLVSGYWTIVLYDIASGSSQPLSVSSSQQVSPDISSDWVVWSDNRNGDWDIYGYSFASGVEQVLVEGPGNQTHPRIFGDFLAYVDDDNGNDDVYLYEISTGDLVQVSSGGGKDTTPDIGENYVVWQSNENGNWDISAYEIGTGKISVVADSAFDERLPAISGETVVWMADDGNDFEVYYSDLADIVPVALSNDLSDQLVPVIASDFVYWEDLRNGNGDVYGEKIDPACDSLTGDCADDDALVFPGTAELCGDTVDNNCDGFVDENCVALSNASCLYDNLTYNLWTDEGWSGAIHSAGDGETVYMVMYGNGDCETEEPEFYLYRAVYDTETGAYVTSGLVDSFSGTWDSSAVPGYAVAYTPWPTVWPEEDSYYYFIGTVGGFGALGDTLLVCQSSASCAGESVVVSDASDVLASLLAGEAVECFSDVDCSAGMYCSDGGCVAEESVDCSAQWDCSNVAWSACASGVSNRRLDDCAVQPSDTVCYEEVNLPEYERSCSSGSSALEAGSASQKSVQNQTQKSKEIPFFDWLNLLMVVFILIGYYFFRR